MFFFVCLSNSLKVTNFEENSDNRKSLSNAVLVAVSACEYGTGLKNPTKGLAPFCDDDPVFFDKGIECIRRLLPLVVWEKPGMGENERRKISSKKQYRRFLRIKIQIFEEKKSVNFEVFVIINQLNPEDFLPSERQFSSTVLRCDDHS